MTLEAHGGEAAVNVEVLAGEVGAGAAGEEEEGCGDELVGLTKSLHWCAAHDVIDALLVENLAVLLGGEEAGAEDVDADVFGCVFAGEVLREVDNGGFGGGIGEDAGKGQVRGDAADVEDGAAVRLCGHEGGKNLATEVRGEKAAIDDFVPLIVGDLLVGDGGVGAGAVDEHIDLAEGGDRGVEKGLDGEALVGGDGQECGFAAEGFNGFDALMAALFAAAGDDDASAGLGDAITQRAAEDAGSADDDGDLVV